MLSTNLCFQRLAALTLLFIKRFVLYNSYEFFINGCHFYTVLESGMICIPCSVFIQCSTVLKPITTFCKLVQYSWTSVIRPPVIRILSGCDLAALVHCLFFIHFHIKSCSKQKQSGWISVLFHSPFYLNDDLLQIIQQQNPTELAVFKHNSNPDKLLIRIGAVPTWPDF